MLCDNSWNLHSSKHHIGQTGAQAGNSSVLPPSRATHLTFLSEPRCECGSSGGADAAPLRRKLGRGRKGAARIRGWCWWDCRGYGGDWNRLVDITLSPPGDKGPEKRGGFGCVRVCVFDGRSGLSESGIVGNKKEKKEILRLLSWDATTPRRPPFPVWIGSA